MKVRVLIADDHAVMRDGLKALLAENPDIEVVAEAGDGRDVVALAQASSPDVAIMDIAMPGMNGIEAARILRTRFPAVRIIVLSMHADAEYVYRALDAGADGYLLKESAGDEVVTAIRVVNAGRNYLGSAVRRLERRSGNRRSSPLASLSARERQVLQLVVEGHTSAEVGAMLHLSPKSVDTYRSRLMKKLGVEDVTALVKFAVEHGVTSSH